MNKEPLYKPGEIINGRVIISSRIGPNIYGRETRIYEYRYDTEPENVVPLECSEETLRRRA
jgi:hypothetical protein